MSSTRSPLTKRWKGHVQLVRASNSLTREDEQSIMWEAGARETSPLQRKVGGKGIGGEGLSLIKKLVPSGERRF